MTTRRYSIYWLTTCKTSGGDSDSGQSCGMSRVTTVDCSSACTLSAIESILYAAVAAAAGWSTLPAGFPLEDVPLPGESLLLSSNAAALPSEAVPPPFGGL